MKKINFFSTLSLKFGLSLCVLLGNFLLFNACNKEAEVVNNSIDFTQTDKITTLVLDYLNSQPINSNTARNMALDLSKSEPLFLDIANRIQQDESFQQVMVAIKQKNDEDNLNLNSTVFQNLKDCGLSKSALEAIIHFQSSLKTDLSDKKTKDEIKKQIDVSLTLQANFIQKLSLPDSEKSFYRL